MTMASDPNCIFCKIAAGKIPARKVYEDDEMVAFHDINPWAPVHILMVPRQHIGSMTEIGEGHAELLGRLMALSPRLMRELGVTNGFRHVINTGPDGHQEVPHLHIHVMGGPRPWLRG
jgi:histidine triad (HIT) family protein